MIFYPQQTNSYAAMVLKYTITGMFCSTAFVFNIDLQTDVISGIKLNVIFVVSLFAMETNIFGRRMYLQFSCFLMKVE